MERRGEQGERGDLEHSPANGQNAVGCERWQRRAKVSRGYSIDAD